MNSNKFRQFTKYSTLMLSVVMLSSITIFGQHDSSKIHKMRKDRMQMMKDSTHSMMENMPMKKGKTKDMISDSMKNEQQMKSGDMKEMNHQKMESNKMVESPLIRNGMIDLNAIDENNDGKVYEDMMDWNVISDKPGVCPECGMTLKEVSLEQAKNNLEKHHYNVK